MKNDNQANQEIQSCSVFTNEIGIESIGTAPPNIDAYLIIENAAPWNKYFPKTSPLLRTVKKIINQYNNKTKKFVRLYGMISDEIYSKDGYSRIFLFQKEQNPFHNYNKYEYLTPNDQITNFIDVLLNDFNRIDVFQSLSSLNSSSREFFVCTHLERDYCCGTYGLNIFNLIKQKYKEELGKKFRLWRISHLGGHRFAPMLLDLPEGRYWAQLNERSLDVIINRNISFKTIKKHYRGSSGIDKYNQILEKKLFEYYDWKWIDFQKSGEIIEKGEKYTKVRLSFVNDINNIRGSYDGIIELGKLFNQVLSSNCGNIKPYQEYKLKTFKKISESIL